MCLDNVYKEVEPTEYGWKIFSINSDKEFRGPFSNYLFKRDEMNESVEDDSGYIRVHNYSNTGQEKIIYYKQGFHFFYYKKDAIEYASYIAMRNPTVKKVKVYDLLVTGEQDEFIVGVCRKLEIIEDKKKKEELK